MEPQGAKQKVQEFMGPAYICFSRMGVVLQDVSVHALASTVTVSDCGLWLYNMCESAVDYSALHLECDSFSKPLFNVRVCRKNKKYYKISWNLVKRDNLWLF